MAKNLRKKYNEQKPTTPTVFVSTVDQKDDIRKDEVYVLYCRNMEWEIDCFMQTALVNMVGIWKNKTDAVMNAVFMIPMRGKVTDCTVEIGSERLRRIALAERTLPPPVSFNESMPVPEEDNDDDMKSMPSNDQYNGVPTGKGVHPDWAMMEYLFSAQIPGYFRIPFDGIKPQQSVRVDLCYTESLRIQNHRYSLSVPLQFSEVTVPQNKQWDNIVKKIQITIHHPNLPSSNPEPTSPSHQIRISSRQEKSTTIIATTAKYRENGAESSADSMIMNNGQRQQLVNDDSKVFEEEKANVKAFGNELELNYSIVADTLSGSLIKSPPLVNDAESLQTTDSDAVTHHILLTPPAQLNHLNRIPRAIYFLIDRSTRLSVVWKDIMCAVHEVLDGMDDTEMFGITLFDRDMHMTWALMNPDEELKMHRATEENKTSAKSWTNVYEPDRDKMNSKLNEPLIKVLDALQIQAAQSGHHPICVIINASQHQDEKEMIEHILATDSNYDAQGCLKQRIFGLSIGVGAKHSANPYFLHYLSSISRGKTIEWANSCIARQEVTGLLSEMESPIVKDLTLNIGFGNKQSEFIAHQMMYPYPIPDIYQGHPVLLKITLPNDGEHEMESIEVNGIVQRDSGLTRYEIPVMDDLSDSILQESFPMELALAESHLNQLHGTIWLNNGCGDDANDKNLTEANGISDITGIPSPTRALQSVQERVDLRRKESNDAGNETHNRKLSSLALPPRTGQGARRKKNVSRKAKAGAIGAGAMLGSVAVVSVFNPFEDVVFGAPTGDGMDGCCTGGCACGGVDDDVDGEGCEACCEDGCTIL